MEKGSKNKKTEESYQKVDRALVYGANKAVRAWNWTTGGTRANLANNLLTVVPVVETAGCLIGAAYLPDKTVSAIVTMQIPFGAAGIIKATHETQKDNEQEDRMEAEALESRAKDPYVEIGKESHKKNSYIYGGVSASSVGFGCAVFNAPVPPVAHELYSSFALGALGFSAGFGLRAVAECVMRADLVKPRKDCVRRGIDKLSEIVNNYSRKPAKAGVRE